MLKPVDSIYRPEKAVLLLHIYDMYSKFTYHQAWKYFDSVHDVEDLVQEVWLKLCTKEEQLGGYSREQQAAYISTTVRNTAVSMMRKRTGEYPLEIAAGIGINEAEVLNEILDRRLKSHAFQQIWPNVPFSARELLERKYILMESDRTIAEAMGISPGSVRMYLTRARKTALSVLAEYRSLLL